MFRKRRRPTPNLGIPPPYSPITGGHADLRTYGLFPYCAMMQIAASDTYSDYVICRGFDPRIQKFVDYEDGNDDKPGISVAKPFGNRVKCYYQAGQVFPALLPTQGTVYEGRPDTRDYVPPSPVEVDWRVGQNPGTAVDSCAGQPLSLDEPITAMTDHNGKQVSWMLIDSGPVFLWVELDEDLYVCQDASATILAADEDGDACSTCDLSITVSDLCGVVPNSAFFADFGYIPAGYRALVMRVMVPTTDESPASNDPCGYCKWAAVTFGSPECCESPSSPSGSVSSPSGSASSPSMSASGASASSPSGESKSPAIVPASWTKDGYTALFTMEAPGVEFTDQLIATIPQRDTDIDIDPRFLEVCERGTVECTGVQPNRPIIVGAEVRGPIVKLRFEGQTDEDVRLVIGLRGTRRGFRGVRFPNRTRDQFLANEQFLKSAYPGA